MKKKEKNFIGKKKNHIKIPLSQSEYYQKFKMNKIIFQN